MTTAEIREMRNKRDQIQKDKNKQFVANWRNNTGNKRRKDNYTLLRKLGVDYKLARSMQFWSDNRISDYLVSNGFIEVDIDG